jgi:hypothetical protein
MAMTEPAADHRGMYEIFSELQAPPVSRPADWIAPAVEAVKAVFVGEHEKTKDDYALDA